MILAWRTVRSGISDRAGLPGRSIVSASAACVRFRRHLSNLLCGGQRLSKRTTSTCAISGACPFNPTLDTFSRAFQRGNLLIWFRNSVIVTVLTVTVVTLLSSLAAFATSKMEFRGRLPLLKVLVSLMVMPPVVMVIPLFILMVRIGWSTTSPA